MTDEKEDFFTVAFKVKTQKSTNPKAMGGTISTELPNGGPPKRLSESPWTDEDEVIVEFFFQNEKSYAVNVAKNWKSYQSGMYACFMIPHTLPFAILSLPFWPHMLSANRKKIRFNEVETLWTRRLAITKNGIAYKTLPAHMYGPNPAQPCSGCCCIYSKNPSLIKGATSKTIPFEKIQDAAIRYATGQTVVNICCCIPTSFPNIDDVVSIDTSGAGIELTIVGLTNADYFKKAVLALKNGRPLPPTSGVRGISVGIAEPSSHMMDRTTGNRVYPATAVGPAVRAMEMTRLPRQDGRSTDNALLAAIEAQNNILRQHTVLLERIASRRT